MRFQISTTLTCIIAAFCAEAATFSLAPVGGSCTTTDNAATSVQDANVVKVTGRGVGTDRAAALKDAYRDAVERAVGLYVDAEQMAKNDEIVRDQILTQSNAYIEKCDIVRESTENGLVTVKILAAVRKQELTKRMTDVMPPQTYNFIDGGAASVHANMVTEAKRNEDAVALVQNYFKDFNPIVQLMKVGLASVKPQLLKDPTNPDSMELAYPLKIEVDQQKYFKVVMPALKKLFDQISLTEPKTIRLTDGANKILAFDSHHKDYDVCAFYKAFMSDCKPPKGFAYNLFSGGGDCKWCFSGMHAYFGNVNGKSTGFSSEPIYVHMNFRKMGANIEDLDLRMEPMNDNYSRGWKPNEKGMVLLYTSVSATCAKAVLYTIDPAVMSALVDWQKKILHRTVEYNIVFKDAKQEEIGGFPWIFESDKQFDWYGNKGCALFMNCGFAERNTGRGGEKRTIWVMTPHIHCWADQYLEWRKFSFKSEDIARIASVSIEVVE